MLVISAHDLGAKEDVVEGVEDLGEGEGDEDQLLALLLGPLRLFEHPQQEAEEKSSSSRSAGSSSRPTEVCCSSGKTKSFTASMSSSLRSSGKLVDHLRMPMARSKPFSPSA